MSTPAQFPPAFIAGMIAVVSLSVYSSGSFVPAWILTSTFAAGLYLSKAYKGQKAALDPTKFQNFPLTQKTQTSPNTAIYRFALPNPSSILGLPIGQHISLMIEADGKEVSRSYTPISSDDDLGHVDLLIKTYPQGMISKFVDEMKIGDTIRIKGPKGNFVYKTNMVKEFGMIAGGTGITPMLQIIRAILKNPNDKTKIHLIFANVTLEDILLKNEMDDLTKSHPDQFRVLYVLNSPPVGWTGGIGYVTKEVIESHCPKPSQDMKMLLCGPLPMVKAMATHTTDLGYEKSRAISKLEDQVFKF